MDKEKMNDVNKTIEYLVEEYTMLVNADVGEGVRDYVVADEELVKKLKEHESQAILEGQIEVLDRFVAEVVVDHPDGIDNAKLWYEAMDRVKSILEQYKSREVRNERK